MPEWLSQRWINRVGVNVADQVCEQASGIPPVTLRVNLLKGTRDALLQRLRQAGIAARPTLVSPQGVVLEEGGVVSSLPGFHEGAFYVEDEAAQLIPPLLDPQLGESVLDACAAPGGKAIHLAELMHNRGTVVAMDRDRTRLTLLHDNCRRMGVGIITTRTGDARAFKPSDDSIGPFDRILVDAPCSGLGVLRRHPEAKWRKESQALPHHHRLQRDILNAIAPRLRPGGVLVYSTCSTEPEENEQVVEEFCRVHAEFRRESVAPWLPLSAVGLLTERGELSTMVNRFSMDGFFAARFRKIGS
jgi:16S rRNA (cytosine967-C5)-methyltransferase